MDFAAIKGLALSLSDRQKQELIAVLQGTMRSPSLPSNSSPEALLYRTIADVLGSRLHYTFPRTFTSYKRVDGLSGKVMPDVAKELMRGLSYMFPQESAQTLHALRIFCVNLAVSKLLDDDKPLSTINVLNVLVPVEQLFDDRFPGYRQSGVLNQIVLTRLQKGAVSCLATTLSASKR